MVIASLTDTYSGDIDEMIKKRDAMCPMGKQGGDAWDVAYAALFLSSDEAKHITGTTLIVDGGISATHRLLLLEFNCNW
ncbi:SDR family oxidoreductase [Chloroflexota bacterium]